MKGKIIKGGVYVALFLMSVATYAQGGPLPPPPPPQPGLPIDGGLTFLLITGVVYGVYAIRKKLTIDD